MTEVKFRVMWNTHKMMADSTARGIVDMDEMTTRKMLFLESTGELAKGTYLELTLVGEDETSSTGAGP